MASRTMSLMLTLALAGDFAAHDDHVAFGVSFAGHAAARVLRQVGVQHRVGNGVANFVGMPFARPTRKKR